MNDDDLNKRLREAAEMFSLTCCDEAAERIEELVAQQEEFGTDSFDRIMELSCKLTYTNAKLAKAVKALQEITTRREFQLPNPQDIARTVLAELEGE